MWMCSSQAMRTWWRVALIALVATWPGAQVQAQAHGGHGKLTGLPIEIEYACGNSFVATNPNAEVLTATYRVAGTNEQGSVRLDAAPGDDPGYSEKLFTTRKRGTVDLFINGKLVASQINDGLPCALAPALAPAARAPQSVVGDPASVGSWSAPLPWPVVAIHLHLLPDGRVLSFGASGVPQIWDPSTGVFTASPSPINVFCSGHAFLADGKLLVVGGHIANGVGLPGTNLFDPNLGTWRTSATMPRGRWYPTATTMANGEVVITAGTDENAENVPVPEVWFQGRLRSLTGASLPLNYYPRAFLAPNGQMFYAGATGTTRYLDTTGDGKWTVVAARNVNGRDAGSAVMYQPGKILYAGGGRTTNTAEVIDLNAPSPAWRAIDSMAFARRNFNLTLLPTGEVLATSGTAGTAKNDMTQVVHAAEIWHPATGTWTTLASNSVPRGYHSTSILLPDGRVLHAGSGEGALGKPEKNFEVFSPPYLFAGARPTISRAPAVTAYRTPIRVLSPDAARIRKVKFHPAGIGDSCL